ncbi:MAG: hypothetical protein GXY33_16650 [Phycisphaerae bacterium]|nr:hypothetical protein [Phycisphaerae bacterium]
MTSKQRDDKTRDFERAAEEAAGHPYVLRLYIAGKTERSMHAIEQIRSVLEQRLPGRYELEVIDVHQHPEMVRADQVIAVPTLVKKLPEPLRKIIGSMADQDRLLIGLDLLPREDKP